MSIGAKFTKYSDEKYSDRSNVFQGATLLLPRIPVPHRRNRSPVRYRGITVTVHSIESEVALDQTHRPFRLGTSMRRARLLLSAVLGLLIGACAPTAPTLWAAKGDYRSVTACVYDALKSHRNDMPWDPDDSTVTIAVIETGPDQRAHVVLDKTYNGIVTHTMRLYNVTSIQDGPDRVRVEWRGHIVGLTGPIDTALLKAFDDCHVMTAG
jgi:hypothetical protein